MWLLKVTLRSSIASTLLGMIPSIAWRRIISRGSTGRARRTASIVTITVSAGWAIVSVRWIVGGAHCRWTLRATTVRKGQMTESGGCHEGMLTDTVQVEDPYRATEDNLRSGREEGVSLACHDIPDNP